MMDQLFLSPYNGNQGGMKNATYHKAKAFKQVRKFGNNILQTGKNLRTIVLEPTRLVWAAIDKDSFEDLISKLEELNTFLISLLGGSQIRRLQDTMSTTYLEILQLRNDVDSLAALIKALSPTSDKSQNFTTRSISLENNALSYTINKEAKSQEKKKRYLKELVEIKIRFTKADQLSKNDSVASDFIGIPLPLEEFSFIQGMTEFDGMQQRTRASYNSNNVWIEWTATSTIISQNLNSKGVESRISLLIDLLRHIKPDGFRAPPCLGYVKAVDIDGTDRFGIASRSHTSLYPTRQLTMANS